MNSEPIPGESTPSLPIAGATLQAVLQLSDGSMDSIAVPVPLPEIVIRVQAAVTGESCFRRARSADSVVRYIEEGAASADGAASAPRRCGRCREVRALYYLAKLSPNDRVTAATVAYCETCYSKASS